MVKRFKKHRFKIDIRMANAEMNTQDHVAEALENIVLQLRNGPLLAEDDQHAIRDLNGQLVGRYWMEKR